MGTKALSKTQTVIGGDGVAETYPDLYKNVTQEQVDAAIKLEQNIIKYGKIVEASYLTMARDLSTFNAREYYLARGYPSFKAWADSPELKVLSYRTANNLIRIADEIMPIVINHELLDILPSVSTLYDLLPMLGDDDAENKIVEAIKRTHDLTTRDAKATIKEIRGIEPKFGEPTPTMFTCKVRRGDSQHRVTIYASDNKDYYTCGNVAIKVKDWARWSNLFGEENIEYLT